MNMFTYEEQDNKKYLVYKMQAEDDRDTLTLEMMSNNRIEGIASSNYIQIDDIFYMKYDITGLESLWEYLQGMVNREKLLGILESIADAIMAAEDYMLKLSSYVLDEKYSYVNPITGEVYMIVLPIFRKEASLEAFLKELLTDIQYDQREDCSYVISLINLFSGSGKFSAYTFKEEIIQLKKRGRGTNNSESKQMVESENQQTVKALPERENRQFFISDKVDTAHDLERKQALDVLFSNEEEETPKKEKKGFFLKKEKFEKPKKTGFWGRWSGNKKDDAIESVMGGIAIPGMEMRSQTQRDMNLGDKTNDSLHGEYKGHDIAIPAQNVEINKKAVGQCDFGETVFIGGVADDEETFIIGREQSISQPEFSLYRCSTNESFRICEEVTRIGRSNTVADICISGNRGVGRVHALLHIRDGQAFIEDNNSKNKTYVDGIQLKPGESPHRLDHGSKIRLGDEELEFYIKE